jgi:hypothetical protein
MRALTRHGADPNPRSCGQVESPQAAAGSPLILGADVEHVELSRRLALHRVVAAVGAGSSRNRGVAGHPLHGGQVGELDRGTLGQNNPPGVPRPSDSPQRAPSAEDPGRVRRLLQPRSTSPQPRLAGTLSETAGQGGRAYCPTGRRRTPSCLRESSLNRTDFGRPTARQTNGLKIINAGWQNHGHELKQS